LGAATKVDETPITSDKNNDPTNLRFMFLSDKAYEIKAFDVPERSTMISCPN
jgi:hypothetical protein